MSTSKISVHVTTGRRDGFGPFIEKTAPVPIAIIKCRGDFGAAWEAKEKNPNILTVGAQSESRNGINPEGMDSWVNGGVSPEDAAQQYYDAYRPIWDANPWIDIWEVWNEWSAHRDWQAAFYIALMHLFIKNGDPWKLACFSESSGNPPDFTQPAGLAARAWRFVRNAVRGNDWAVQQMIPALKEARLLGHYLSLHEYGDGVEGGYPFHTGRYKALYDILQENDADCKLIITESGFVEFPGTAMFMDRVRYLDDLYAGDDFLKGSALFTLGDWYDADIPEIALGPLAEHIVTFRAPDPPPDPEQPPPESDECKPRTNYARTCHWVDINEPIDIKDQVWIIARRTGGTVTSSADDALYGPGLDFVRGIFYNVPEARRPDFIAFRDESYPNSIIEFATVGDADLPDPPAPPTKVFNTFWPTTTPQPERVITSDFGLRESGFHYGVDIRAAEGTPLVAVADGVVDRVGYESDGFGLYLVLRHRMGDGRKRETFYAHLLERPESLVGVFFLQGETMPDAFTGNTGKSTGAHLHHEIRVEGVAIDPMSVMIESEKPSEPPTEPPPPPPPTEDWQGVRGVGWRADGGPLRGVDMTAFDIMRLDGAKLQTPDDKNTATNLVRERHIDPLKILVRFFVAPAKWNEAGWDVAKFMDEARLPIEESWAEGIRWFELFNEPNLADEYPPGDASTFTEFAVDAALALNETYPGIKLVSPALSPQPNAPQWWQTFSNYGLFGLCGGLGAHHYGVDANNLLHGTRSYLGLEAYLRGTQQIHLTEFSINRASETDAAKGQAYIDFWNSLEPIVARADIFVLSAAKRGENEFEKRRETLVRQKPNEMDGDISEIVHAIGAR